MAPKLPVQSVALNSYADDTLDFEGAIRVLACEGVRIGNGSGSIRFAATWDAWSASNHSTAGKDGVFNADPVTWDGKDYGQLAQRLSEAIAGLGKAVAANLPMQAPTPAMATDKSKP